MGTTVEALAIVDNNVIYAHVGDSRIGLLHQGEYQLLTSDHSLVNELVKAGQLTEEEAANHPQKISLHSLLDKQILLSQI